MILALTTAALGHIIWGTGYVFTKIAMEQTPPEVFLSLRFLLSFLFMSVPILSGRQKFRLFDGRNLKPLLILALSEPLCFFFETYGLLYTNATFAGAFVAIIPVVSVLTGILFLKEYPTRRQAFFCLFPVVGIIIMTVSGKSLGILSAIGVIFLLCNCFASATYKTFNRKASAEFSAFERTYAVLFIAGTTFTLASFVKLEHPLQAYRDALCDPQVLLLLLLFALVFSILCNMLVNFAATRLTVAQLATMGTLTTLVSMATGIIFLKEPYSLAFFAGAALILFGIWQVTRPSTTETKGKKQ